MIQHLTRLALATSLTVMALGQAWAADAGPCDQARRLVGEQATGMSAAECRRVVTAAEEERWQLWLDMALAHEHSGDHIAAISYYERFLDAATGHTTPLTPTWSKVREDAAAAVARIDAGLKKDHGRLTVSTTPTDAMASFEGKAAGMASHVTPFITYLAPGPHNLQLYHPSVGATRDITFDITAGQTLSLEVDLRTGATGETAGDPKKVEPAPVAEPDTSGEGDATLRAIGWLGVAVGVSAIAAGTVFYTQGDGEISSTDCTTELWCAPTVDERALRRDDGEALRDRGIASWIAGGVLLAGGITAVILGSSDDTPREAAPATSGATLDRVTPVLLPDGAGLGATVSF